ncbi:sodium- and chloride-dependent neutral and basic amino acid transporter B(0+) [Lepeophtheirus salmonis]|uniref:sodium- and chloride-dependent neutral and basic amino acid transporter B(0+) n=1 Tax=Lepeophtheirus salmonis TaxID=72036 RepID=UPI001AE729B1|nr:sodium- and chloride-dependent neutral and basic amino acid transporter B(0+)-like [Lepeophtheirus salmonis]
MSNDDEGLRPLGQMEENESTLRDTLPMSPLFEKMPPLSRFRCLSDGEDRYSYFSTLPPKQSPEAYSTSSSFQYAKGTPKRASSSDRLLSRSLALTSTYTSFDEITLEVEKEACTLPVETSELQPSSTLDRKIFPNKYVGSLDSGLGGSSTLQSAPSNSESIFGKSFDDYPMRTPLGIPDWNDQIYESGNVIQWSNRYDFVIIGLLLGCTLRTLIELPLMALQNGGWIFLVIYGLFLVIVGIPLSFLLSALGQYSQRGLVHAWKIVPFFIGIGSILLCLFFVSAVLDSAVASYALLYVLGSFLKELPWTMCDGDWNNIKDCDRFDHVRSVSVMSESCIAPESNCTSRSEIHSTALLFWEKFNGFSLESGREVYYEPRWETFASAGFVWLVIWLISIKNFEFVRKVLYSIVIFFILAFTTYFIRMSVMEGTGHWNYFGFDYEKCLDYHFWARAAGLAIRTSFASGLPLFLGSRNFTFYKVHYQTVLLQFLLYLMGILSTLAFCALFAVNKNLVHLKELDYISFTFVVPSEAFRGAPMNRLWSLLFFALIFSGQLGSVLLFLEGIYTTLEDVGFALESKLNYSLKRFIKCTFISICGLICTLVFSTSLGLALYHTIIEYFFGITEVFIALLTIVSIAYIYGLRLWSNALHYMLKTECRIFYSSWLVICPLVILYVLIVRLSDLKLDNSMELVIAAVQSLLILQIPICAFCKFFYSGINCSRELFVPSSDWGLRSKRIPTGSMHGTLLLSKRSDKFSRREDIKSNPYSYY